MSCKKNIGPKRRDGFTLVELLVVIAIIALLLSILMPSLAKVREAAKRVVCQSNLKQQGLACSVYMEDNQGVFPGTPADMGISYWYWGGKQGKATTTGITVRYLNPYIGRKGKVATTSTDSNLKVFRCPSDKGAAKWTAMWWKKSYGPLAKTVWDAAGTSYMYNSNAFGGEYYDLNNKGLGLWQKKMSDVKRPSMCILVGDFSYWTYASNLMDVFWHDKKQLGWANLAFVDGHINYIRMTANNPDIYNGPGWTVLYDPRNYRR